MKYDHLYTEEDRELVLHENDTVLAEIRIPLPKAPKDKSKIVNYGLHPNDQKFEHIQMPHRLINIEEHVRRYFNLQEKVNTEVDHLYKFLEENKESWLEEILWIKQMIHYRYHGMWVYIHGKPVYYNRWYFFFLNQWNVGNEDRTDGLPDFRDRDWMWWTASLHLYNDTTAPFNFKITYKKKSLKEEYFGDKREWFSRYTHMFTMNEKAIDLGEKLPFPLLKKEEGIYVIDMGGRTIYGINYPKGRRDGATYRAQCLGYCIVTEAYGRFGGIQSKSDTDSEKVFTEKLIKPFQNLWFFFKPYQDKGIAPKTNINFQKSSHSKNTLGKGDGILGWIEQRPSGSLAFDGEKIHAMHHDEVGKKEKGSIVNVQKRWNVAKKCLATGDGKKIIGWASLTSTVAKMEKEGGREFFKICRLSHHNERNQNGQTASGLVNMFIPHCIGLEGFIDEFGNTVVETPDHDVKGIDGKIITQGSRDWIMSARSALELAEAWDELNEAIRQAPMDFAECFKEGTSDSPFNMMKLTDSITNHKLHPEKFPMKTFNLEYKVPGKRGPVKLVETPNGKFRASWLPPVDLWNKMEYDHATESFRPKSPIKLVVGADPVKYGKTKYKKKSNGGLALWYPRDEELDPDTKPKSEWESHRFRVTYNNPVDDKDEFVEDALMLCILTGAYIFPESNLAEFNDHFYRVGYGGYCLHYVDSKGVRNPQAGRPTGDKTKQDIFNFFTSYVNDHIIYEAHLEMIEEIKDIGDPKNMTDYDLFAAGGMGMIGGELLNRTFVNEDELEINLSDLLITYNN